MLTKTLALTHRGLRRDMRVLTHHLLRLGILLVVGFAVFFAHLGAIAVGAPGLGYFTWITWTTLTFSTLAGATFFATAITEEKEEQTLGLLTLANIRPAALIVGKFLPRLLNALLILTVVLPFTLLAITLGGVTWNQVWAAYWTLLAHVVFMGSIGLFFSVLCRTSGAAIAWSILAMLTYFAGVPLLSVFAVQVAQSFGGSEVLSKVSGGLESIAEASAFWRLGEILRTGFDEGAFGIQVVGNLAASGVLLGLSWALFGVFNRSAEGSAQALPMFDRALRFQRGSRRPWAQALAWKDFHYVAGGWEWMLIRVCVYGVVAVATALIVNNLQFDFALREALGGTLVVTMLCIAVPVELTILASRLFRAEVKEGTWPTLAGLPRSIPGLAAGKVGGALIGVAPALSLAVLGAAIAPDAVVRALFDPSGTAGFVFVYVYYFAVFLVFLHLTALYSIIFNSWAGVLLAFFTVWIASCFTGPLLILPALLLSSLSGMESEWIGIFVGLGVYGGAFLAICFGLQVLIVQQLRAAAAR